MNTHKQTAYAILNKGLSPYVSRVLTKKYGDSWQHNREATRASGLSPNELAILTYENPIKLILTLWNSVFRNEISISEQDMYVLDSKQQAELSREEVVTLKRLMVKLLSVIGAQSEVVELEASTSAGSNDNIILNGVGGVAMLGGAAAAGYLLFKGASLLIDHIEDQVFSSNGAAENLEKHNSVEHEVNAERIGSNAVDGGEDAAERADAAETDAAAGSADAADNRNVRVVEDIEEIEEEGDHKEGLEIVEQIENKTQAEEASDAGDTSEEDNPFICPITLQIMENPVITPQGICFERQAILDWIEKRKTCPITNEPLTADKLIICYTLRNAITDYKKMMLKQGIPLPTSTSSKRSSRKPRIVFPTQKPTITLDISPEISDSVEVWNASTICSNDRCPDYPERSKYIVFPESTNFFVDRCTGYISIENRGDHDITLVSRERAAFGFTGISNPFNVGARLVGSYVLRAHTKQGFDFRGYYCIEVPHGDVEAHDVDLLIYGYANKGGGRGNWLSMA